MDTNDHAPVLETKSQLTMHTPHTEVRDKHITHYMTAHVVSDINEGIRQVGFLLCV